MSKIDEKIINNIKMLSLDMIYKAGSGDAGIVFSSANLFYNLFKNHLIFDPNDENFINRDRIVVSNRLLPLLYSCHYLFYKDQNMDDLKDYKSYKSLISGCALKNNICDVPSFRTGDVISSSVGISLGSKYLKNLIKIENAKAKLVSFKTYCIFTMDEIMSGLSYEAMSFASTHNLNDLIFIVIKNEIAKDSSNKETFKEDLTDRFIALNFNVSVVNNFNSINGALDDAKNSKKPSVIIVNSLYGKSSSIENNNKFYNLPLKKEEMDKLRSDYEILNPFTVDNELLIELRKDTSKRLSKYLINYHKEKDLLTQDLKIKEIVNFLEAGKIKIDLNVENIKINDNYEEKLTKGNNKVLNILANKSPFVLCGSDDNFVNTLALINKTNIMSNENPTGRNILFGNRTLAMGGIALGLSSLGFKVFISTPLINAPILNSFVKLSSLNNLDVNYIFTNDSFTNPYEANEYHAFDEIDSLAKIPNIILYRPCDINELIGVYDSLCKLSKSCIIILNDDILPKFNFTNSKYVVAGSYRVKKEEQRVIDAIIIASGSEVPLALKISKELEDYDINLRVVSMPSKHLFELQSERYKQMLLPKDVLTFTIEYASFEYLGEYATTKECAFQINNFFLGGTKEEKLKYYNLNIDAIKAKMMEILKK